MADRDKKKALYRAKLNEKQQKSRIDSPLAINHLKASASKNNVVNNTKSEAIKEFPKQGDDSLKLKDDSKPKKFSDIQKSRPSSELPADFFDHGDTKKQKVVSAQVREADTSVGVVPSKPPKSRQHEVHPAGIAENVNADSETKQIKGELPKGFFDNKDADLRARGIEPVKPDVKDEYKQFEKLIQEDLAEVDNRFEEEESEQDDTSSEDEGDETFAVDWRAQHLLKFDSSSKPYCWFGEVSQLLVVVH
ncbi:hypothetical protein RDABS01_012621 [Bienertia sinuspersici]